MIKATTAVYPPVVENIPDQLTERPQWVCWRYEERDGKMTKVPYTDTGLRASTTDLLTWTTCAMALAAYERGHYDGIGFVFSSADPFVGIDLDDCRAPDSGDIAPWAQKIIDRVQEGYIEISPSGTGVHIIVEGTVRDGRTRKEVHEKGKRVGRVEMYGRAKFFTITGELL
jgi:primase-polymerase (primpol)-like protein